jgi:hypothetical protein
MKEKIKCPKKPKMPFEPYKPTPPQKVFNKKVDKVINIDDGELGTSYQISFKDLLDIRNKIESKDENILLKVTASKDYDGCCDYDAVIDGVYFEVYEEADNISFEKEMFLYEEELKKYQQKYQKYLQDQKDYKEQLKKYNLEYKQYKISILEKQIEKLKDQK